MYIADAYSGLFVAGTNGRLATKLATSAEGVPFCFLNGLDVDPLSGLVYFTDFSTTIQLRLFANLFLSFHWSYMKLVDKYTKSSIVHNAETFHGHSQVATQLNFPAMQLEGY